MTNVPDPLDDALEALAQSLGDSTTLASIVINLRASGRRLLDPLKTVLQETRDRIDHALEHL